MSEFSRRVLKPTLIPIVAMLFIAVLVFAFSRILLAVPEAGSTTLAFLMAGAVLLICSVIAAAGRLVSAQRLLLILSAIGLLAGGGATAALGMREIEKHAEEIEIAAKDLKFSTDTLQFPEEQAVALRFVNNDAGIPHNVTIARDEAYGDVIVQRPPFNGVATQTYDVEPLEEGVYFFRCDVHPDMAGNVISGEATAPEPKASPSPSGQAAPGEPESTPSVPTGTEDISTTFDISAEGLRFSTDEIQLKAAADVVIVFENKEAAPHNIAIHRKADFSDQPPVFREEPKSGPATFEYEFTAPEAGTYYFRCDVHPDMKGTVLFR